MVKICLLVLSLLFTQLLNLKAQIAPVKVWDKTLGGIGDEGWRSTQAIELEDGTFIIAGTSLSPVSGNRTAPNLGNLDYWVIKLDTNGTKLWDKSFGGDRADYFSSIIKTNDGGYLLGGSSSSGVSPDKSEPNRGNGLDDFWILKLDRNFVKQWDKTFGGNSSDGLFSIDQTSDGGYILGGISTSGISGDKTEPNRSTVNQTYDYWIVKIDSIGNKLWDKTYGGNGSEYIESIRQTADGGYILGGVSNSDNTGDKSEPNKGTINLHDQWIVKLNANGNKQWDRTIGGDQDEYCIGVEQTKNGDYIVCGSSGSGISGDKTQPNKGGVHTSDYWIVKLAANGMKLWDKSIGGSDSDGLWSYRLTADGGIILCGISNSGISFDKSEVSKGVGDYWVVKADSSGNKIWDKTLGGNQSETFPSILVTSDGGAVVSGASSSNTSADKSEPSFGNFGSPDIWVVKLAAPCTSLTARLSNVCVNNSTNVALNVIGIQPGIGGIPSWTLNYTINGIAQTATGSSSNYVLSQNVTQGTVYTLVSITSGTCIVNLNQSLTIEPLPVAPVVTSGMSCGTGSVALTAIGAQSGNSYVWYDTGTGGTALVMNTTGIFITPILTTTKAFYVAIRNSSGCEGPRIPIYATIVSIPVSAGANETICVNTSPFLLTGYSPAGGTWSGPGVSNSGIFNPEKSLIGIQTLTYTVNQEGCNFSASKQIIIPESVELGNNIVACDGKEITLRVDNFPGSYLWSDGSTNALLSVNRSGRYWVRVIQNGCVSLDTITVSFEPCPEPLFPTVVTPNGDGLNDTFSPQFLSEGNWELEVYNRWGNKLFESKKYQNDWPNKKLTDGPYFYLLKNSGTGEKYKGVIDLIQ